MKFTKLFKKKPEPKAWKDHIRFSVQHPLLIGHYTDHLSGRKCRVKLRSIQEVAEFICDKGQSCGNLTITTADKAPFIRTFGIYLSRIEDAAYKAKLTAILHPMQEAVENTFLSYHKN